MAGVEWTGRGVKVVGRFLRFLREVREEIKLVSWPTREEVVGAALVVCVGVLVLTVFISAWDFALSKTAQLVLR